eukprot:2142178-Pyramimonas_sp.AAC.1
MGAAFISNIQWRTPNENIHSRIGRRDYPHVDIQHWVQTCRARGGGMPLIDITQQDEMSRARGGGMPLTDFCATGA